jgi:cytochrome P450
VTTQQTDPTPQAATRDQEMDAILAALATPEGSANPYPHYKRMREIAPVCPGPNGGIYLTGYHPCLAVIRDPGFHAQNAAWMDTVRPGWREHPGLRATTESFLFQDPPEHTRLRRLVAGAFTQRQAVALRDFITGLTDRVLDLVADAGSGGGTVDLHEILAATLPIGVVGHVLGVPEADHPILREPLEGLRLSVDGTNRAANIEAIDRGGAALIDYFAALAAQRRQDPRDDVVTALATAADRDLLTADEVTQTLTLIFSAGIESMVDMLLNGLAALLADPAQTAALRADPALTPAAVEEMLRYDTPVQAMGRIADRDTEIDGVPVHAGQLVLIMLGAAHRDPTVFPDPDTFDITRAGGAVLSYGGGVHHCLGAPLARMQASVFIPALLARFPTLRPAGPPVRRGFVLRGFADFPVALR